MNQAACGIFALHPWELPETQDDSPPDTDSLQEKIHMALLELTHTQGIRHFWLVMDQGVSSLCAEEILRLRENLPLRLTCVIPFEEQHLHWPEYARDRYFSIVQQCDEEYLLRHEFSIDCYQQSVQHILAQCAHLFVAWNGRASDAGDAIEYARRINRQVSTLDVSTCRPS